MNQSLKTETTAAEVVSIYTKLLNADVRVWIDGGWAVDALLGQQTRSHGDVDVLVEQKDITKLRTLLEAEGFINIPRNDASEYGFHLGNEEGAEIDVHGIVINEQGAWKHADPVEQDIYPPESLTGQGSIDTTSVNTIAPEYIVLFHGGYELQQKDFDDVSALCEKFVIPLPEEYKHFVK